VGAVGRGAGVGLDLGAIERDQDDQAQADHPGRRARLQRLDQQAGQGLFVADPEPRDRHMVGPAIAGRTRKATSSWQRRLIWREERMPVQ
jgi:hypothetical protein